MSTINDCDVTAISQNGNTGKTQLISSFGIVMVALLKEGLTVSTRDVYRYQNSIPHILVIHSYNTMYTIHIVDIYFFKT